MKGKHWLLLLLCVFFSCDFPKHYFSPKAECVNHLSFPGKENPEGTLYKTAVLKHLKTKNPKDFRYNFKTFLAEGNKTFMLTSFRSDSACFEVKMLVDKWDKLAGMRRTNGYSYPNELYDLEWEIQSLDGVEVVSYIDMHRIID